MYAAKDAGRNAYRFFTADMNARVQLRLQLETDMRRGLMDDEFFLVYQPQIEMQTGRACGVEALVRWRDPERGIIAPAEFIPIAEESGMIQALGARVLRDACRQVVAMAPRRTCRCGCRSTCRCSSCSTTAGCRSSRMRCASSGLAAAASRSRDHRERDHHASGKGRRHADEAEADGRVDHRRRLRHRLLEPVVPRAPADPGGEDRPAVRARSRARTATTRRSRRRSSRCRIRSACAASPKASRHRAQFNFLKAHGCEEAQGFLIAQPLSEPDLRVVVAHRTSCARERQRTSGQGDLWQRPRTSS